MSNALELRKYKRSNYRLCHYLDDVLAAPLRSNHDAIGLYLLGGLYTLTKTYTVYSSEKFITLPDLNTWWFMKEIKDKPDGMYYDGQCMFVKIITKEQ